MPLASTATPFNRSDLLLLGGNAVAVAVAALTRYVGGGSVLAFVCAAVAVALLASLVGRAVDQLGDRFGPGATGVLQSALGNLPELFIALFALKAGLLVVVQAAVIGSILSNLLLVLGLCFLVGGLRHGPQKINAQRARRITALMVLSVAALIVPSLASYVHAPAAGHEETLSLIVSVILLAMFVVTLPSSLKRRQTSSDSASRPRIKTPRWSLTLAVAVLVVAATLAALVSDWFVYALEPAMRALDISDAFAGLVIVAIASNAIENAVGVRLAARNQPDYAFSLVANSPLQIALVLAPLLVIAAHVFGFAAFTLVFPPMLVASVAIAVIICAFVTFDGESNWTEGASLIAVYVIIAASFWWG